MNVQEPTEEELALRPSHRLTVYREVWMHANPPSGWNAQTMAAARELRDDPKAFYAKLDALEIAYLRTLQKYAARDKRLREQAAEIERLKKDNERLSKQVEQLKILTGAEVALESPEVHQEFMDEHYLEEWQAVREALIHLGKIKE